MLNLLIEEVVLALNVLKINVIIHRQFYSSSSQNERLGIIIGLISQQ
jgi:hypothetical protein